MYRYIVTDASLMRSEEPWPQTVLDSDHIVLPYDWYSDLCGSKDAAQLIPQYLTWLRIHGHQVWLAKDWETMCREEDLGMASEHEFAWRDDVGSARLRYAASTYDRDFEAGLLNYKHSDAYGKYEACRQEYVASCRSMSSEVWRQKYPNLVAQAKSDDTFDGFVEVVRTPELGYAWPCIWYDRYRSDDWTKALNVFPDRFAVGRVGRTVLWYSLTHASGKRQIKNNYEDAAYVVAASYTNHLATNDFGMASLAASVFPNITLHSTNEEVLALCDRSWYQRLAT